MNIVIKLPNDLNERVLTFPFLHTLEKKLKEKLAEDEVLNIHLISLQEDIDVLNLLPFHAFYHELEREDIKTIFSMHRACGNFKINQVDIFISTTDSFVDASIGKNFAASEKIGFAVGKNGWVLDKKITKPVGAHKTLQTYELLSELVDEIQKIPIVCSRSVPALYTDWSENPYTVVDLDLVKGEFNPEWKDFFELFTKKKFILMCSDLSEDEQVESLGKYVKDLSEANTYKVVAYDSNIEFAKLISFSLAFVSQNTSLMGIAAYVGAMVFHLNLKDNLKLVGPEYFIGEVKHFDLTSPVYRDGNKVCYTKIFDEIYTYIESRTANSTESE